MMRRAYADYKFAPGVLVSQGIPSSAKPLAFQSSAQRIFWYETFNDEFALDGGCAGGRRSGSRRDPRDIRRRPHLDS
jgi:hypothetical protein